MDSLHRSQDQTCTKQNEKPVLQLAKGTPHQQRWLWGSGNESPSRTSDIGKEPAPAGGLRRKTVLLE